jgi:hypothetical protein
VPKSKTRDKVAYTPPAQKVQKIKIESSTWTPRIMMAFFVVGLAWMVTYYFGLPLTASLGAWNVLIGFVFMGIGFAISTRWK